MFLFQMKMSAEAYNKYWSGNDAVTAVYILAAKTTNHKAEKKELSGKTSEGKSYKLTVDNTGADKKLTYTEGTGKNAVTSYFTIGADSKIWYYDAKKKESVQIAQEVKGAPQGDTYLATDKFKGDMVAPLMKATQAMLVDLGAKKLGVDGKFGLESKRAYESMTSFYAQQNFSTPFKTEVASAWWDVMGYAKMTLNNSGLKKEVAEKVYKTVLNEYYGSHVTDAKYDGKNLTFKFDGKDVKAEDVKNYVYTAVRNFQARINTGRKEQKDKIKQDGLFGNETLQAIVDNEKYKEKKTPGSGDKDLLAIKVKPMPKKEAEKKEEKKDVKKDETKDADKVERIEVKYAPPVDESLEGSPEYRRQRGTNWSKDTGHDD